MKQKVTYGQMHELTINQQVKFFYNLKTSTNYMPKGKYFEPANIGQMIEYLGWRARLILVFTSNKNLCNKLFNKVKKRLSIYK